MGKGGGKRDPLRGPSLPPQPSAPAPAEPKRIPRDEKTDATDKRDCSVYLSVELHRALKVYAAENDLKFSEVVERACREWLSAATGNRVNEH